MYNKVKIPRKRNPHTQMFSFRMNPIAINKLMEIAKEENIGVRTLAREIIFAYVIKQENLMFPFAIHS